MQLAFAELVSQPSVARSPPPACRSHEPADPHQPAVRAKGSGHRLPRPQLRVCGDGAQGGAARACCLGVRHANDMGHSHAKLCWPLLPGPRFKLLLPYTPSTPDAGGACQGTARHARHAEHGGRDDERAGARGWAPCFVPVRLCICISLSLPFVLAVAGPSKRACFSPAAAPCTLLRQAWRCSRSLRTRWRGARGYTRRTSWPAWRPPW